MACMEKLLFISSLWKWKYFKASKHSPDLLLFYRRWVLINSSSSCHPMCPDKTARGSGITSRVIRSERVHTSRREVLTFPIKASGKDEPTLTATMRCGTRSGERPQSWQETEAEVRKLLRSLWGASYHLAAGGMKPLLLNVGHSPWHPLRLLSSSLYLEPGHLNTACCTQGSDVLHCFQDVLYHAHRWA